MPEFKKSHGFKGGGRNSDFRSSSGGRGDFQHKGGHGKPDFGHGRDRVPQEMFPAICAECGKSCEVPFRPTGERPVLCRNCFGGKNDGPRHDRYDKGHQGGPKHFDKPRPGHDDHHHALKPRVDDKKIDELEEKLEHINRKLDAVLERLKGMDLSDTISKVTDHIKDKKTKSAKKKIKK